MGHHALEGYRLRLEIRQSPKTVVHIVVDEDENGFVIKKWSIKNHSVYAR